MDAKKVYRFFVTLTPGQFLFKCLFWAVQRLTYVKIFRIMTLHLADVDPAYLAEVPGFAYRLLDHDSCRKFASDPIYELPESFLDHALENDYKCYAFVQDDVVASYGWIPEKSSAIDDRFLFHHDNTYIQRIRGFTHPNFRGLRLHGFGLVAGLKDYQARGYKGMISVMEAQNYYSRRSLDRIGYETFGMIFVIKLFGRYFIHASKGCKKLSCTMTVLEK